MCQELCQKKNECMFWTMDTNGCLLKNENATQQPKTGSISGPKYCQKPTAAPQKGGDGKSSGVMAAGVGGGIVLIILIIIIAYVFVKRKRADKLHLFSVFYDPTKQPGEPGGPPAEDVKTKPSKSSVSKADAKRIEAESGGVSNPIYDVGGMKSDFAMGELDSSMFTEEVDMYVDDTFTVPVAITSDVTDHSKSMANPLYQDPYMEDDDSPLAGF